MTQIILDKGCPKDTIRIVCKAIQREYGRLDPRIVQPQDFTATINEKLENTFSEEMGLNFVSVIRNGYHEIKYNPAQKTECEEILIILDDDE